MGNILLAGYYGFGNVGDEAILASTVSSLRAKAPDLDIRVLSKNPGETFGTHGTVSYDRMSPLKVLSAINQASLVVFGGGSLLQDSTSFRSLLYYVALLFTANIMGKPTVVYANGVGPLRSKAGRLLVKKALSKAKAISVRDQESLTLLEEIGVSGPVELAADPAFLLSPPPPDFIEGMLASRGIRPGQRLAWLGLRPGTTPDHFYSSLARGVELLRREGFTPCQMIMQERDIPVVDLLNGALADIGQAPVPFVAGFTPREVLGALAQGQLCIGMRLHALILSARGLVPFLGVEIDPKIGAFCRSLGFPAVPDPRKIQRTGLTEAISATIENRARLCETLRVHVPKLVASAQENIDGLLSVLREHR